MDSQAQGLLGWYGEPWVIEQLHQHSDIELNLVAGGELHYLMGGSRLVIRNGEVAVFWAVTPHRIIHCTPQSQLGVLHVPLTEFLRWTVPIGLRTLLLHGTPLTRQSEDTSLDRALFQRWASDLQRSGVPTASHDPIERHRAAMLEVEAFLHRFWQLEDPIKIPETLNDARRSSAERLAQVIATRHAEPVNAELIAQDLGLNPNYAMALFKQVFGLTMHEFLTLHRVAHAQRLLITGDLSVLDVAYESGFQSLSRFYAVFAKASGMSPLAYRQRHGA
jgi:AraC family transcriptional regulator, melibiose operon regulatory protein